MHPWLGPWALTSEACNHHHALLPDKMLTRFIGQETFDCNSSLPWIDVYKGPSLRAEWNIYDISAFDVNELSPGVLVFRLASSSVDGISDFVCRSYLNGGPLVAIDLSPQQPITSAPDQPKVAPLRSLCLSIRQLNLLPP